MKPLTLIAVSILFTSCCDKKNATGDKESISIDTIYIHDTIIAADTRNWQDGFGLTHDPAKDTIWFKPVSYYIADERCSGLALAFYYGRLKPADDQVTDKLLELAATDNHKLRPFYRWCLNKTIIVQDGGLAEHTGIPARKYAEKFPREFFGYMDHDTTGNKYADWVNTISYSGYYDKDDYKKPQEIRRRMAQTMKRNCIDCNEQLRKRIDKFAADCFP